MKMPTKNTESTYKWPVTFKRIATAIAFSPTALAVLHEAIRIAQSFQAEVFFIHVGERNTATEKRIAHLLNQAGCEPENYSIMWKQGDPATAILAACEEKNVDLLIAGALQKENLVQYYKGSIARKLCRKANCSLLLLTQPGIESKPCERIVVNGLDHPKTPDTIRTACYVSEAFASKQLTIVEEIASAHVSPADSDEGSVQEAHQKKARIARNEHLRLSRFLAELPEINGLTVKEHCIFGKKGYSIGHFAETSKADLLMVNSPDTKLGFLDRVFTHDLEYILSDMPCDILIVHSTRKG
jgi:nucleotide-binding universal stress UspA family protein